MVCYINGEPFLQHCLLEGQISNCDVHVVYILVPIVMLSSLQPLPNKHLSRRFTICFSECLTQHSAHTWYPSPTTQHGKVHLGDVCMATKKREMLSAALCDSIYFVMDICILSPPLPSPSHVAQPSLPKIYNL